ncbi:hypothetical protein KAZ82_00195 [Candidatus Babeliales bacterium]|nr:hypothetical protein [Candidatus Babeliales bacterium]
MNQNFKKIIFIASLFIVSITNIFASCASSGCSDCASCPTSCAQAQNLYQPHALSVSMSREIMLEQAAWYPMMDDESWHGTFGVGFSYMRSFGGQCGCCTSLGSLPFWSENNSNVMTLGYNTSGSNMDVYQLGLGPVDTTGTVSLSPVVYQVGADFLLYVGTHKTERGFFLKIHGPVGVTNINPGMCYTNTIEQVAYPEGILAESTNPVDAPYSNIQEAWAGGKSAGFLKPMVKGLISSCKRTSSAKFGDPEFTLGYNVYANDKKHLGIGVIFSAPTGNKAEGIYVLEPIFGRNGHWGAGGEIIAHWKFWESAKSDDKWAQLFFDGDILHLFKSKHIRSFDLAGNGPGSKYLLLAKYIGNDITNENEFQDEIINAVNITTVGVASTFAAEGNFAIALDFHWGCWSFEIGYEGWGRTCESLCLDCSCPGSTDFSQYAIMGRQAPYSSIDGTTSVDLCQPSATIGESEDRVNTAAGNIKSARLIANRLPELPEDALDIEGQRARAVYTSKPFFELCYTWNDSDYVPYLGLTGGAEIPNTHKNEAAKMWNIGLNGGIAF